MRPFDSKIIRPKKVVIGHSVSFDRAIDSLTNYDVERRRLKDLIGKKNGLVYEYSEPYQRVLVYQTNVSYWVINVSDPELFDFRALQDIYQGRALAEKDTHIDPFINLRLAGEVVACLIQDKSDFGKPIPYEANWKGKYKGMLLGWESHKRYNIATITE